jgi:hypothetical protein
MECLRASGQGEQCGKEDAGAQWRCRSHVEEDSADEHSWLWLRRKESTCHSLQHPISPEWWPRSERCPPMAARVPPQSVHQPHQQPMLCIDK